MATSYNGTTPASVSLEPGVYNVTVTKDGYRSQTKVVTVVDNQTVTAEFNLVAQAGTLNVTSEPAGATVVVALKE